MTKQKKKNTKTTTKQKDQPLNLRGIDCMAAVRESAIMTWLRKSPYNGETFESRSRDKEHRLLSVFQH